MPSVLDTEISSKVELGCFNDDAKLFEPYHKIYLLDDFVCVAGLDGKKKLVGIFPIGMAQKAFANAGWTKSPTVKHLWTK